MITESGGYRKKTENAYDGLSSSPSFKKTTISTLHQFPGFSILSFQMENPKWMKHL